LVYLLETLLVHHLDLLFRLLVLLGLTFAVI
jgi:hypothetical protein